MNPKVDEFLERQDRWKKEIAKLRTIALACKLDEDFKWGQPCYTVEGKNVAIIHGFKDYCAILFMKGALLEDPEKILFQQTENVQAGRQVRFTTLKEIAALEPVLKAYLKEAIELEKAGAKVARKSTADYAVPEELVARFDADPALKEAFDALTPGRQRAYLLHFSGAKQAATRAARIDKYAPKILAGKGLDD